MEPESISLPEQPDPKPGKLWKILTFPWRHKILTIVLLLIIVPSILGVRWLMQPSEPEYVLGEAVRGDIQQTVEAVGTVISEKDLQLKFPVTGVVAEVFVEEGDTVTAGQEVSRLRNDIIQAEVSAAQARIAAKEASLRELQEGTRPEDIMIAEAELLNKRASLDAAKTTLTGAEQKWKTALTKLDVLREEAKTSLAGYVSVSQSTASEELTRTRTAMRRIDDVLEINNLQTVIAVHAQSESLLIERHQKTAERSLDQAKEQVRRVFEDYREALTILDQTRRAILLGANVIDDAYNMIAALPLSGNLFDQAEREAHKATLSTASRETQDSLSAIDAATKNLRDAAASFDTKIAAEENTVAAAESTMANAQADIRTFESAVRTSEAELARKRAGPRQTEIDAARAEVSQAYADLKTVKARLEDSILRAPFDGVITKVEMKVGEFTGDFENFNKVISMLGASPYRIEMYVAEIDIPKVQLTQTGAIELDSFPREDLLMSVSEIDPVATEIDGVPKYRVKLDFPDPRKGLRIGMSGDAEIFTDQRMGVVTVPGRAVFRRNGSEYIRVLKDDGMVEEREVETGLDGSDGELEIIEGLGEGEQIVVLIRNP